MSYSDRFSKMRKPTKAGKYFILNDGQFDSARIGFPIDNQNLIDIDRVDEDAGEDMNKLGDLLAME